jgi:hypothetical protein
VGNVVGLMLGSVVHTPFPHTAPSQAQHLSKSHEF